MNRLHSNFILCILPPQLCYFFSYRYVYAHCVYAEVFLISGAIKYVALFLWSVAMMNCSMEAPLMLAFCGGFVVIVPEFNSDAMS